MSHKGKKVGIAWAASSPVLFSFPLILKDIRGYTYTCKDTETLEWEWPRLPRSPCPQLGSQMVRFLTPLGNLKWDLNVLQVCFFNCEDIFNITEFDS